MDFTDAYTWNVSTKKWTKRKKKNNTLGRMRFIPPNDTEDYYLRLLLTHVKGSLSFEDVRTVNNIIYDTYKEAAIAHELIEDDTEFDKCLEEAVEIQTGKQLRDLYSLILIHNTVKDPFALWDKYKDYLCDDLLFQAQKSSKSNIKMSNMIYSRGMREIEHALNKYDRSLTSMKGIMNFILSLLILFIIVMN